MKKLLLCSMLFFGVCFQLPAEYRGRAWLILKEVTPNLEPARIVDSNPPVVKVERRAGKTNIGQCAYNFPIGSRKAAKVEADFLMRSSGKVMIALNAFDFEGYGAKAKIRKQWFSLTDVEVNGVIIQKGTKWYRNEVVFRKFPLELFQGEIINVSATFKIADEAETAKLDAATAKKK